MTHLLVICHDVVDELMAGPGIRYWEMARALGRVLTVTLATPGGSLPGKGFSARVYHKGDWSSISPAVSTADVLMLSGDMLAEFPQLATCGKPLAIEATYPYTFEGLQLGSTLPLETQMPGFKGRLETARRAALAGDFFFCANERQRDYWLGVLDAFGRINPYTYAADKSLVQLINIVPFGLPSRRLRHTAPAIKGVIPGIQTTDRVILWGGGLWEWLDSLNLVRAVARVVEERPDVRLVFPGTRHPNPAVPEMPMHRRTRELSDHLGLTGKVVFFGDWVPYEVWPNYLLEADIGASLHFDTLETHFAFRTRVLDYIWAGLPMVVTGGDSTSELVTHYGLGEVVPPDDDEAVAAAIGRLLDTPNLREAYQKQFAQARPSFTWERACEPILRFCEQPSFAADRADGIGLTHVGALLDQVSTHEAEITRLNRQVAEYERMRTIRWVRCLQEAQSRISRSRYISPWLDGLHTEWFYRQLTREVGQASGHAFVDRAYWHILRREPDAPGFRHFADSLTEGKLSRRGIVASLVRSTEFRTQERHPYGMVQALHQARCQLVRSLPPADHVLDLGGAAPASIQGTLFVMGYPYRVRSLTIVDLPPAERLNQYAYAKLERTTRWIETEMGPVRYIHTSMTELSMIETNSLDLVFAGQSIEHVSEAEGSEVMREVWRVLRPGGSFCLDTPNRTLTLIQSPHEFLHPEHRTEYRVEDLTKALQSSGFKIKEIKGICPMPRTVQSGVFSEQEFLDNVHVSGQAETCYLFYVHCIKPGRGDKNKRS